MFDVIWIWEELTVDSISIASMRVQKRGSAKKIWKAPNIHQNKLVGLKCFVHGKIVLNIQTPNYRQSDLVEKG